MGKKKKRKEKEKKREEWKELDYREKSDRIICSRAVFERIMSIECGISFFIPFFDFFIPFYRIDIDYSEQFHTPMRRRSIKYQKITFVDKRCVLTRHSRSLNLSFLTGFEIQ